MSALSDKASSTSPSAVSAPTSIIGAAQQRLSLMDTPRAHMVVVGLALADLVLCVVAVLEALYDPAATARVPTTQTLLDGSHLGIFRTVLFWTSVALRIVFLFELGARVLSRHLAASKPSSPSPASQQLPHAASAQPGASRRTLLDADVFDVVDAVVIIALIPLKFALAAQDALVAGLLVAVRLGRVSKILAAQRAAVNEHHRLAMTHAQESWAEKLELEKRRSMRLAAKLEMANVKLKVLMGWAAALAADARRCHDARTVWHVPDADAF
ncbi:hypothetical protein HK105_201662 [Polyrhizophydium stewartii]|uniref:Uncharacterized protein n=1 Tax=Polyrhizophydium stewartii TaxID=2732419 RepID=A0ABR4NH16_9FUNG